MEGAVTGGPKKSLKILECCYDYAKCDHNIMPQWFSSPSSSDQEDSEMSKSIRIDTSEDEIFENLTEIRLPEQWRRQGILEFLQTSKDVEIRIANVL